MNKLKKRSEVDRRYTWATEDLYINDEEWNTDYLKCEKMLLNLESYKGKISMSSAMLLEYFQKCDEVTNKLNRIYNYAQRKFDEDTRNTVYQDLSVKAMKLNVNYKSSTSFEVPELLAISDEKLNEFYNENQLLLIYEIYINEIRRKKEHVLSEVEEKLLAQAQELASSPSNIMGMFRNADIKYPSIIDEKGNEVRLTASNYISYLQSGDRRVRKDVFEALYNTLLKYKNTISSSYFAHVKQLMFFSNARKYNSTLERALDDTNVPVKVYKNLIKTVNNNLHYMHNYVRLRKKLLNLEELHMYDLYTPIIKSIDTKISFEEAKKNIYNAVAPLGKEYQAILKEGFDNRWIDVYENDGKRSGAYSSGAKPHPYVLLNYKEGYDGEFTLAHEMGHAIHSYLSNKVQPTRYSNYKIFVAEVASTCNEALLMEYLLSNTKDRLKRASLINHFLEKFRGTIYRQTMFAEFEMLAHEMAEKGESLTSDKLNEMYYDLNVKYFGDDIVVDKEISVEWTRVHHFFYNFYVYQYATGYSAAIALSRKILNEGESAVRKYLKFLGGGCSLSPIELLEVAGVDMSTSEPINDALKLFGDLIDELEELLS